MLHNSDHNATKRPDNGEMDKQISRLGNSHNSLEADPFSLVQLINEPTDELRPGNAKGKRRSKAIEAFIRTQENNLLELRAALLTSVQGIARETRFDHLERPPFFPNGGDGDNAAWSREVALSLLSEGTNALHEIDDALARIEAGTYGVCEMSGRAIPMARLEAIPFARFTVECQSQLEKESRLRNSARVFESPFSVARAEESDDDDEHDDDDNLG